MNERRNVTVLERERKSQRRSEEGQSIVLIALIIVGLVAFAGLAVDVGFLFARNSQFSAAVDAAALAGVVDLHETDGLNLALQRADQFLDTNRWSTDQLTGTETLTDLGVPQFNLTATWPVDTFFLALIGFDQVDLTHSASAAFYARTDIPLTTALDRGVVRTASQFIYGANACTSLGDAISPKWATSSEPNPLTESTGGIYTYRIAIDDNYIDDTGQNLVHVQLFDPDSYNKESVVLSFEKVDGSSGSGSCNSGGQKGVMCVIETNDTNPFWFQRVDETYDTAKCPNALLDNGAGNTVTRYELYYLDDDDRRQTLGVYSSNKAASVNDTDLKWVTPGAEGGKVPTDLGSFVVNLNTIPQDEDDVYNLFLDVSASNGTAKNVWDLWAGPPEMATGYSDDVNERNLQIMRNTITTTNPSMVYAEGYLPVNTYQASGDLELPIAALDPAFGGGAVYISAFDMDNGVAGAGGGGLSFTIDTVAPTDYKVDRAITCPGGNCNYQWINPQAEMSIPTTEQGIAFYGGNLMVTYQPKQDDHTWTVSITRGRPFLTR